MIKRMIIAALVTFSLATVAWADVPDSGICITVQAFSGLPVVEAGDPRIATAVANVLRIAESSIPVSVCELVGSAYGPIMLTHKIHKEDGEVAAAIVIVARMAVERYGEPTLRAMIAHEVAHTKLKSPQGCTVAEGEPLPDLALRLSCETPVDALAASWVGVEAVLAMLGDMEREVIPYLKPEHHEYTRQEIAGRITALRALR